MNLCFINKRTINKTVLPSLPSHLQEQFLIAGEAVYGKKMEPNEIFKNTYEGYSFLWDVVNDDKPNSIVYEVWVFDVDSACVFLAGTINGAGVYMQQYGFMPEEETDELQQLSDRLAVAYKLVE